jgi:O-antigen/teichoic acid export membrane protein
MDDLIKNIKTLAFGSGLAKLIALISIPILTRLYTVEEFGVLTLFNSITLLLIPLLTLRYVVAIPLPKRENTSIQLIQGCLLLLIFMTVIFLIITNYIYNLEIEYFAKLGKYIYFIPLIAFMASLFELLSLWMTRNENFKLLSKCNVLQALIGSLIKILLSQVSIPAFGLIIGQISQQFSAAIAGIKFSNFLSLCTSNKPNLKLIFFLFLYYKELPAFRLLSQFLLIFAMQLPIFAFSYSYSTEEVGQLGLAMMTITLPMSLFGATTGKAYYAKVSKIGKNKPKEIYALTTNLLKKMFVISFPLAIAIFIFSPYAFKFIFGHNWQLAGQLASLLSIILVPQFLASPVINVFNVFMKQKLSLLLNIVRFFSLLVAFYVCFSFEYSPLETIKVFSLVSSIYYILVVFIVLKVIENETVH